MSDLRRDLVVLSCAVSAGIHAALAPDHFEERIAAGVGFAASAIVLAALAAALARDSHPLLLDGAILTLAGLIGAYVLAVTTGVPIFSPEPEAIDSLALATKGIEVVGLLAAVAARGSLLRPARPIPIGLIALIASFSALATIAISGGHHSHGHDHAHQHAAQQVGGHG
jgi:4-amino-4-deoxy-L-arabinose transferase-like glycosyltransferase